jgi:hypothetical protein
MGVILDLRMIDHEYVVEHGLPLVNTAIAANDASILVEYILSIPFTADPDAVEQLRARCNRLREVQAPDVIIQDEERVLALVTGDEYSREKLTAKTLDELRELLGTWCWAQNSFRLDKAWYELDWFLQPADGPEDRLMFPARHEVGDPAQTLFDQALLGSQPSPLDDTGTPVIRTCGSQEDGCFGYNPPDTVRAIDKALSTIEVQRWDELIPQRIDQYRRASFNLGDAVDDVVARELEFARRAFPVLQKAYNTACERGFGVACEYSL